MNTSFSIPVLSSNQICRIYLLCISCTSLSHSYTDICHLVHTGSDYLVNIQNPSFRTFKVVFQPKEANSTENVIASYDILEGSKQFRLQIAALRFIGQVATLFRAQDGLTITFANVNIADDDCELRMQPDVC